MNAMHTLVPIFTLGATPPDIITPESEQEYREQACDSRRGFWATLLATIVLVVSLCGCPESDPISVDILSATPASARPGEVLQLTFSGAASDVEYSVVFGSTRTIPIRMEPSFLTVMVPPISAGEYQLGIAVAGEEATGVRTSFTVLPADIPLGTEAADLLENVSKLISLSQTYTLATYEPLGGNADHAASLESGFENCLALLSAATTELGSLSTEELETLCQMVSASGLGQKIAGTTKMLQTDYDSYFHQLLVKADGVAFGDAAFFGSMTRLDMLSAALTDTASVLKAVKYGSLAAAITGVGAALSASTWATIGLVETGMNVVDDIIDGALLTDLKQIHMDVEPDVGLILNPGETGSVALLGTFGAQQPLSESIVNATVDILMAGFSNEIRHFLDGLPGVATDLRTNLDRELLDTAAGIFADAGLQGTDSLFGLLGDPLEYVLPWKYNVPLDPNYYTIDPTAQVATSFAGLIPGVGALVTNALQDAVINILGGEDTFLTNEVVVVDDEAIVSYDRHARRVTANAAGQTTLHARPYRFDEVMSFLWLFPIEGWLYLEEGDLVDAPDKASLPVNMPLVVTVSNESDPVYSDLDNSPVSGVVPGVFTTDGGSFEISVSPVDSNGDLLFEGLTVDNFSFSPIQVTALAAPDVPVANGMATPDSIETILPGDPSAGVNVAVLLDSSGSMDWNDPTRQRVLAAKALVDILRPEDKAAVLDFGTGATNGFSETRLLQSFTSDHDLLHQAIDRVKADGGTPMYESLGETISFIQATGLPNLALLVLTDGEANSDVLFDDVVASAQAIGLPLFTVGLGTDVDFTQLQALAVQTGGTFASAVDAAGLQTLFESLGVAVSAGRIIVHASGTFDPALQNVGQYAISGELRTKISGLTIPTPFDFVVEVVSVGDGLALKMLAER